MCTDGLDAHFNISQSFSFDFFITTWVSGMTILAMVMATAEEENGESNVAEAPSTRTCWYADPVG